MENDMLKIAVCDDEKIILEQIKRYVEAFEVPSSVDVYHSGEGLLMSGRHYDIIFLDIDMQGINGIETARRIRRSDKKVKIIYVTGYNDFASSAFSVHAFGYLLKPVKQEQIHRQLREAVSYTEQEAPVQTVRFETESGIKDLDIKEIYYFEYLDRKIQIKTDAGIYRLKSSITMMAEKMEKYGFCMPHKSFVVNLYQVKSLKGYDITMMDGSVVPLSQKKSVEFREKLSSFLARQI